MWQCVGVTFQHTCGGVCMCVCVCVCACSWCNPSLGLADPVGELQEAQTAGNTSTAADLLRQGAGEPCSWLTERSETLTVTDHLQPLHSHVFSFTGLHTNISSKINTEQLNFTFNSGLQQSTFLKTFSSFVEKQ